MNILTSNNLVEQASTLSPAKAVQVSSQDHATISDLTRKGVVEGVCEDSKREGIGAQCGAVGLPLWDVVWTE